MKKLIVESLAWDTEFFCFPVGKVLIPSGSESYKLSSIIPLTGDYRVAYVISPFPLINDIQVFEDEKVILENTLFVVPDDISEHIDRADNKSYRDLMPLALASGVFSRFLLDLHFKPYYEALYKTWLERSLTREIADEVLVYQTDGCKCGFVTLKKVNKKIEIGLIAIDEHYRGQGIGSALMKAVYFYASMHGYKTVRVATQRRNMDALKFYHKNGFQEVENSFIYNLWR